MTDVARLYSGNRLMSFLYILHPRMGPNVCLRFSTWLYRFKLTRPFSKIISWVAFFLYGIEYNNSCSYGGGLLLAHPSGCVLGGRSIGRNVTIFQGVTLGAKTIDLQNTPELRPSVGDNVTLGTGAKIIGGISIGNNCSIGANSVVLSDLAENSLAVGVPAKVIVKHVGN